jgi:hypothetical protein
MRPYGFILCQTHVSVGARTHAARPSFDDDGISKLNFDS